MESLFNGVAGAVIEVQNTDVLMRGWVPPNNDVAVCLVPPSVTREQSLDLQQLLEANIQKPVLVLTNTTQLVKLSSVSDKEAEAIIKGRVDQINAQSKVESVGGEKIEDGETGKDEGISVREEACVGD